MNARIRRGLAAGGICARAVAIALAAVASACGDAPPPSARPHDAPLPRHEPPPPEGTLELVFPYGSEKQAWVKDVTESFNRAAQTTREGHTIRVRALPMGSGESIDEILSGRLHADLVSPASDAFVKLGNARSQAATGKDLVGPTQNLVLSPVVIAMWKPMAAAAGWGAKPVGWTEILGLATEKGGWTGSGFPQWGAFKFGHTHPEYSNSGLISVLAETYAATGKRAGLTLADVEKPETARFVGSIEASVVHYGSSTGFFGTKMFEAGPQYLSAAVLYESTVIESYARTTPTQFPIVAVYPREGTFWSDHPVGVVQREWVTPERRAAAETYIAWLTGPAQQRRAMEFGFRPADPSIPLGAPIDAAHGVDPAEPRTTLEVPSPAVMDGVLSMWRRNKKHTSVALVLDVSGSMTQDDKIGNARLGAAELIKKLGDEDDVSVLAFNGSTLWAEKSTPVGTGRAHALAAVGSLFAEGGTALYDATAEGFSYLQERAQPGRISAVVVLSDGDDTGSRTYKLDALLALIRSDAERKSLRVFTIGYGEDANAKVLKAIADATQAKYYAGTTENIRDVFREISTFF